MIRLIITKELKEIISSLKFVISFTICSILIILTFFISVQNYRVQYSRYQAAKTENLRKMEGLTDWARVNNHRVFLPPQPLETLVSGISNDIGRTITVAGRGELEAVDSRYNDNPVFAVFRFLDLHFIFLIVLSLFAILFAYDVINGEKERGTLRLTFANAVPRVHYILGKLIGSFTALALPLLIPLSIGFLLLIIFDIPISGDDWLKLILVIIAGLLYFGIFLTMAVFVSAITRRPESSFLILVAAWIFSVLIIPRASVLLAGRVVDVPTIDEIIFQKSKLSSQLLQEDRTKMSEFKPTKSADPQKMVEEFNEFMQKQADDRDIKMQSLASRLNEDRRNKRMQQERLAFGIARLSPSAVFSFAVTNLAETDIGLKQHFLEEVTAYQKTYGEFMKEKTGLNLGGNVMIFRVRERDDEEAEKAIDPNELPPFGYHSSSLGEVVNRSLFDFGLLALFNLAFFVGAFVAFLRYDLR